MHRNAKSTLISFQSSDLLWQTLCNFFSPWNNVSSIFTKIEISQEQSKNLATKIMITLSSQNCKCVLLPSPLPLQHHPFKWKMNFWYRILWRLQTQASDDEGYEHRPRSTKLFKHVILINLYVPDPENIYVCTQLSPALWYSWSQRHYSPTETEGRELRFSEEISNGEGPASKSLIH